MTDKTDALVLVRRSQLIELQAEVSDDASLAHERIRSILAAQPAGAVGEATFAKWLATEMPAGTVIGDPKWWANRIARQYRVRSATPQPAEGTKVCPTCSGWGLVNEDETPQPAEGDGAVAPSTDWPAVIEGEDGHEYVPRRVAEQRVWGALKFSEANLPSAAAAVPEIRSCRDAFESYIAKDGGDLRTFGFGQSTHYSNSAVNNAWSGWQAGVKWAAAAPAAQASAGVIGDAIRHLSKWLDQNDCECESGHQCGRAEVEQTRNQLLALAQQEPRHDALADGESASA